MENKLPNNWTAKSFSELFPKIVVGYVGNINDHYCNKHDGIPFYRTLNIRNGKFIYNKPVYVTHEFHNKNKKSQINNDDILIARVGANLGMVCKVSNLTKEANIANAIIIKSSSSLNSDFFTAFLLSKQGQDQIHAGAAGGAQGVFNTKLAQQIIAPVPPLDEQTKIAKILSTWDKAIATTERLLANSQQHKQALMQQLLTGKKRFAGFTEDWKNFALGQLFSERIETNRPDLALLSITTEQGVIDRADSGKKDTSSEDKSKYRRICPGDIGYNTMRMWQGVSGLSNKEGIVSPAYTILRPTSLTDSQFAAYLFKTPTLIHIFMRHSQGLVSDTWNLKYEHFAKIKVFVPCVAEQQKIAQVLSTADAEITNLQAQLAKLRLEKKALMQQLLTGQRRVRLDDEPTVQPRSVGAASAAKCLQPA